MIFFSIADFLENEYSFKGLYAQKAVCVIFVEWLCF